MPDPTVACILLTADRPEYARRAVEAFRAQTYPRLRMLIWDTGALPAEYPEHGNGVLYYNVEHLGKKTIGELRNDANGFATIAASPADIDIVIHWDDDDWSHPNRIAEQVALLQSNGADAVGYNQMLFWRETPQAIKDQYAEVQKRYPTDPRVPIPQHLQLRLGEAWLYTGDILGTSLCYWRKTWEAMPFRAISHGEDTDWLNRIQMVGKKVTERSSIPYGPRCGWPFSFTDNCGETPRMIARIHAGNAKSNPCAYDPQQMANHPEAWKRVPAWDSYCRSVME